MLQQQTLSFSIFGETIMLIVTFGSLRVCCSYGKLVILLPDNKCDGVNDSGSLGSLEMYVKGPLFNKASTSTTIVCSICNEMWALPSTFLIPDFVWPTRCSQKPPNHGAFLGMNFQVTPSLLHECGPYFFWWIQVPKFLSSCLECSGIVGDHKSWCWFASSETAKG